MAQAQWIQHSEPKTLQDCVQGSQTQSGSTVNQFLQNFFEEKATLHRKKSTANYQFVLGVLFHSETSSDPETTEDETANITDLTHFPMVESDTETIIPDLAPDLASETIDSDVIPCPYFDLTSEEIDLETFLDNCPNSVSALVPDPDSGLVPALVLNLVPNPIPEVCPNAALGPKEKQPQK